MDRGGITVGSVGNEDPHAARERTNGHGGRASFVVALVTTIILSIVTLVFQGMFIALGVWLWLGISYGWDLFIFQLPVSGFCCQSCTVVLVISSILSTVMVIWSRIKKLRKWSDVE